ncbi:MAG: septal ring lytic transglycosylase RlpA family protein [Brevinematales bacterium]|nr:septal ring lytic transglycosylase RlpA family protein [Brevinematales bacterium]
MKKFIYTLLFILAVNYGFSQYPKYLYGTISYYGDEFKGKKTASGEIFDPNKYTAAHKELPFGTEIMVENLENGRKAKLIINDRGPFVANRILDVSRIAAEELGFVRKGTTYAKITILKIGDGKIVDEEEPYPKISTNKVYSSKQILSISNEGEAQSPAIMASRESNISSSSALITPQGAYSNVTSTNIVIITKTNEVTITNKVVVPVTNVIEIPPYEDKIVEKEVKDKSVTNLDNEFIISEPEEYPPLPTFSSSFSSVQSVASSSIQNTNFEVMEKEVVIDVNASSSSLSSREIIEENKRYYIQVGAFKDEKNALKIYELLRKESFPVFTTEEITKGTKWIKVRIGYFKSKDEAEKALKKLEKNKVNGMILIVK